MYPYFKTCAFVIFIVMFAQPIFCQCIFNFTPGLPCPGELVTFTVVNPMGGSIYKWDLDEDGQFDDGTGSIVSYTYPYDNAQMNFIVKLEKDGAICPVMQTVSVKAGEQPMLGVVSGGNLPANSHIISSCTGGQMVTLVINNTSPNPLNFTGYTINWGDGSPVQNLNNSSFGQNTPITHAYSGSGYNTITLTGTYLNGCILTSIYQFFSGGNPDIGLSSIGNTNGLCAPASLIFNVQSYQNNPLGTTYQFYENDQPVGPLFTQASLPNPFEFIHLFDASSCGEATPDGQYQNAFSIKIVAKNPCGEKAASVQPITASTLPSPDFSIQVPKYCPDEVFTFTNTSTNIHEFNTQTNLCVDTLNANWEITPGVLGTDWAFVSGGLFNFNTIKIRFLKPGTYTIKMTLNPQPVCGASFISKTITVLEPPIALANAMFSNPNGCLPLTVNFNNQSTGYQISYNWHISPSLGWTWQPGGGTNDVSIQNPSALFTTPGTYTITLTVTNVCSTSTWTRTIVVKDKPTVALPALGPFCQSAVLNFTSPNAPIYATGNGTISAFAWSFPGGSPTTSTLQNPTGIQYGPVAIATNFTYTASVTNECGTNTSSSTFAVQVPATITLQPDISICVNAPPFQLTPMPTGGTWSISPVGGVTPGGLFTPANAGGPGVKTLTYIYGVAGSPCTATKTMTITLLALPMVDVPATAKSCVNQSSITLTNTPVTGGVWTSSGTGQVSGNIFNPFASGAGIYTLTYSFTDINGCNNSDQLTMTVNALPVVLSSNVSYCNTPGLVPLPTATPPGGTWTGVGVVGNQFDPQTPGGPVFTATYSFTDLQTNCSNAVDISITVANPANVSAGADKVFCLNDLPFDLNSDAIPSSGGIWSGSGVSGNIFNPSIAGAGTHTIILNTGTGNCLVNDTRIIQVNPLPTVAAGPDNKNCTSDSIFILSSTPSTGGVWTSNGTGQVFGNTFNASLSGVGTYTLTYSYTDNNGCKNSDQMTMTVNSLPIIIINDTVYCNTPGLVLLPVANPPGGIWSGTGILGNQFNPQTIGGPVFTATYSSTNTLTNCSNSKTINITVTNPATVSAGADKVFCLNDMPFDLNTDATPSSGGQWSGPGVAGNIFDPTLAGAGTHTISLNMGTGNCLVNDTRVILVNPLPTVAAGPDNKNCISDSVFVLSSNPPTGGLWTSSGIGQVSGNTFNAATSGVGAYTLTYSFTDNNGCKNSDQMTMTVNALPIITVNDTVYCNTPGLVLLPMANPLGGVWTGPGISGNQFNPQTAGGPGFTATYSFTNTLTNCINSKSINIMVVAPDNVNAGADKVFCLNDIPFDLNVDATPSIGGNWSGAGISGSIFNPAVAGIGTHIINLLTGFGNCAVMDTRTIKVNPLPLVVAGADAAACVSEISVALSPSPVGGVWITGIAVLTGNSFQPDSSGTGVFPLTWSFTDSLGCVNTDSLVITVNPLPVPISHDTVFCNTPGLVLLPVATPVGGSWSGMGSSGFNFDPVGAGGVGDYPLTYHYTDQNGCSDSTTVNIKVTEPIPTIAGPNDTICIFDGLLQLAGFSPATGGHWSGSGILNDTSSIFNPLLSGGGPHSLVYSYGIGNCEVRDTAIVLVIAVNIEAGDDLSNCFQDPPLLLTNFNPVTGGTWTGIGITNPAGNFDPGTAGVGSHVLNYEFQDPILGCTFRDSLTVQVNPMPESDFAQPTATCINDSIQFQNLSLSTFDVLWDFEDGQTSTLAQPSHTYTDTGTYIITLKTTNEFGCSDMMTRTIFVTEPPFAFFTPLPDSGCAVLPVFFQNESFGWQTTYTWMFGNLQTDSLYTPGLVLLPGGTKDTFYIVTLTATNLCAVRTWTDSILVHPLPIVQFGTTTDTICNGDIILFANTTLGQPETFEWDFGNGQTSTDSLPNPMQYFTDSLYRTYTIRLISTNFCGSDTAEHDVIVKPVDVKAFFNVPNLIGCEPYTVQFSNFATPGAAVSWQFGDGNMSSAFNPVHTFLNPGIYTVIQKATSGCGFDSTVAYITVLPAPEVSFVCLPQICKEDALSFTNTSPSPLAGVHWNFGDGDSSLLNNPTHSFDLAGISTVVLTGISAVNGCPGTYSLPVNVLELPDVNFSTDKPDGCVPLTVGFQIQPQGATYFEWNFGDGNTALGMMPTHTFNEFGQYEINLVAIDLNGCRNDTILRYITVHPIPSPSFAMQRDRLCGLPVLVDFTNNTPDAVGYTWNFGDGTGTSVVNNPQHSYPLPGDYQVQLTAENTFMCRDTAAQIFSAYAQPTADFAWNPEEGCAPLTVQFENLSTFATSAHWTFSDGGQSDTLAQTAHTFYDWGKHGATLIVSHRNVCFDTLALTDIIEVFSSPTANFSFEEIITDPASGMFEFTDLSVGAVRWYWEFGDGDTSTLQNPPHRFYSNGQKLVKLTVWGENECPDDTIQGVTPLPMHGLFIPNAFTPGLDNGDAALFQPKGVGLREFEIAIYSSFGQLLWTSVTEELIDGQPGKGWNGNYRDNQMPQDVYTWQVKNAIFDDGTIWSGKRIGSLTLIR